MFDKNDREILKDIIKMNGFLSQIIVSFEELSELQKELSKYLRGRKNFNEISEEMADVYIMLEQLILMFNNKREIERIKLEKMKRIKDHIKNNNKSDIQYFITNNIIDIN